MTELCEEFRVQVCFFLHQAWRFSLTNASFQDACQDGEFVLNVLSASS